MQNAVTHVLASCWEPLASTTSSTAARIQGVHGHPNKMDMQSQPVCVAGDQRLKS